LNKECLKKFSKVLILLVLFSCKGEDPLTPKKVEGALGPKYPDLVLNNLSPTDGQIGVPVKPNIVLSFSDAVDPLTVKVNLNSPACVGTVQLSKTNFVTCEQLVPPIISSPEKNSFTISPVFNLSELTYYKIKVTNQIYDTLGQQLSNPYKSDIGFQTLDATPPTVIGVFPSDNSVEVNQNTGISLFFSELMDTNSITTNFFGSDCTGTLQISKDSFFTCVEMLPPIYNVDGMSFTVYPRLPLESNHTYQARALKEVQDLSGNHLANEYISQGFKVRDWTAPVVQTTIPIAGSSEVPFYTLIIANFSKKMDESTIQGIEVGNICAGSFQLSKDNFTTCLPVDPPIVSENKFSFSFKPKTNLEPGTNYKFKFTTEVKDVGGLALENPFIGSFATAPLPFVVSTNPAAGAVQVPEATTISVTFSRNMDSASIYTNPNSNNCDIGTFNLALESSPNTCIPLGPVTASTNTMTFTAKPILTLLNSESYIIKISHLVRDNSGNDLGADYVQNPGFRIFDTTPPIVEPGDSTPTNNSINFVISDPITIVFDESMNPASMGGLNTGSTRTSCIGTIQLSKDNFVNCVPFTLSNPIPSNNNKNFTVKPLGNLEFSTQYQIKVTTAAQDKYGNHLATAMYINFKSIDPVEVQSTNPPNALNPLVSKDTNIQITFNRAVLNSTISFITSGSICSGSIQLSMNDFATCVSFLPQTLPGTQNQVITLKPLLPLDNFTLYKIRVLQTVMDENNITMASTYTQSIGFRTIDTVPPLVASTTPANNFTYVARNSSLSVNFNEGMDPLTISTNSTTTICSGSLQVSKDNFTSCVLMTGQPIQDPQGMVWTMQPAFILDNFTYYKFRVLAGVKDTQGNALVTTYNQNPGFQTIDDIPPVLLSSSPASGTTGVLPNSNIVLTFNETMDVASITSPSTSLCGSASVQVQIGPTFASCVPVISTTPSASNTVFTFTPGNSLGTNGTLYNIQVRTNVRDAQGNPLVTTLNIPFRATDTITPSVTGFTPPNGSVNQSIGSSLSVNFSEEINPASLITNCTGTGTWFAQDGATCLLMNPFVASPGNFSFTMAPQSFFPRNTTVTVTIRNVIDFTGNVQTTPTTYSFTTNDPGQALLVLPSNGATAVLTNSAIKVGFDRAMNPSTLTLNTLGNSCTGNIQVSPNNFVSCIPFAANIASPTGSEIYELDPLNSLDLSTNYTVRVTTAVKTTGGYSWPINQDFSFQTVIPPFVQATVPAALAINVARNTPIDFIFSKSMLISSITTNSANTNCTGTLQVSTDNTFSSCLQMTGAPATSDNRTFRITPASLLPNESTIYLRTTTGVQDTVGQNMLSEFNSSFKTQDDVKPLVSSTLPSNGASNVINNASMKVSFSEPMNTSTISVQAANGTCTGSIQISSNAAFTTSCLGLTNLGFTATNTTFNFKPSSNLPNNTTISGRVLSSVRDVAGNSMASNYTWTFTSNTVPAVSSITPASSATYIPVNTNIVVGFNKSMNPATFTPVTNVNCSGGNILFSTDPNFTSCVPLLTQTFSANDTTVTYTFFQLAELRPYFFKILNSVSDVDGLLPISNFNSSFTTGDLSPPSVISVNPVAGATNAQENLISITFSKKMSLSSMTTNCASGNIQVSQDNFATCAPLNPPTTSDNITFNFVPSPLLLPLTAYQIRVKSQVQDLSGNNMTSPYLQVPAFTVKDYVPPTIANAYPTSAVLNAPTDASITITFSEVMDLSTITSNATNSCDLNSGFLFSNNNFTSCLPVTNPFTTDQTTFNFVPLNGLYNGAYQYRVNTSVKDTAGNNLAAAYNNSFTVNDTSANTVTMTSPANGSLDVPFGLGVQSFAIRFTATVDSTSVTTNQGSNDCSGNVQLSSNNFVTCIRWAGAPTTSDNLNFNLGGSADNLLPSTNYILKVKKEIVTTAAGKSLKGDYLFNFTTAVSPTVISLTPAQNATDIPTFGPNTISVTFDTAMNPSTIVGTADKSCGNTGVDLAVNDFVGCLPLTTSTTDNRTFYLTPTTALVNNTKYRVRITPKATSSLGNPMVNYYPNQFTGQTFTTTNKPTVASTVPANGATGVSTRPNFTINFSEPMVNVNTNGNNNTSCIKTIQLSNNDFSSCVSLSQPVNSNNNITFTVNLGLMPFSPPPLQTNKNYKLKISGEVMAVRNNIPMGTDYIVDFTTGAFTTSLAILNENLNCENGSTPTNGFNSTKISWVKSKETLVNSPEGGYEIFYQKDDTNLYCKKISYENGEWAPSETSLNLDQGLWRIRVKSFSRLNPQGSALSDIKEVVVH
jgi:hypothetical protein